MRSIDCVFEKTKQAYVNVISTSNPISTSVFQIILFLISDFIIFEDQLFVFSHVSCCICMYCHIFLSCFSFICTNIYTRAYSLYWLELVVPT